MHQRTVRTGIYAAYRRSALRVISAFRTVSTDAVVVIAGMIHLKLVEDIEKRKHDTRREMTLSRSVEIRDDVIDKWQQDWSSSIRGTWTYRLI